MKWIFILLISFIFSTEVFSENCVSISSNVTRSDIPEESEFATEEKTLNKVITDYYGGKGLKVKVQFVDPKPYPSYIQWLVDWWNSVVGEGEEKPADIEILFSLTNDKKWKYEGIKTSKDLSENHLLPKVMAYIKQYIIANETDVNKIIKKWIDILSKALDKKWLKALETQSDAFAKRDKYDRDNNGWDWPMAYYEFVPYQDTQKDTLIIGKDTLITADYIIKQLEDKVDRYRTIPEDFQDILHNNYQGPKQIERYSRLKQIKNILENYGKYNSILEVSKWTVKDPKYWNLAPSPSGNGYKDKNSITDHLYMQKREVGAYLPMPTMCWRQNYGPWKATRCNVFVSDFTKATITIHTAYPWGPDELRADGIYTTLPSLPDFVELDWSEVSKYTNAGFPVYIVTPEPEDGPAGHIAISFPGTDIIIEKGDKEARGKFYGSIAEVVQAGPLIGKMKVNEAWGKNSKDVFTNRAKVYLFLGHLCI